MYKNFIPITWRTGTKHKEFAFFNILHPSMEGRWYLKKTRPLTKRQRLRCLWERHINQTVGSTSFRLMHRAWVNAFIYPTSTTQGFQPSKAESNIYREWKRSEEGTTSLYVSLKYFLFLSFLPDFFFVIFLLLYFFSERNENQYTRIF